MPLTVDLLRALEMRLSTAFAAEDAGQLARAERAWRSAERVQRARERGQAAEAKRSGDAVS
jgi:hypothetical protein